MINHNHWSINNWSANEKRNIKEGKPIDKNMFENTLAEKKASNTQLMCTKNFSTKMGVNPGALKWWTVPASYRTPAMLTDSGHMLTRETMEMYIWYNMFLIIFSLNRNYLFFQTFYLFRLKLQTAMILQKVRMPQSSRLLLQLLLMSSAGTEVFQCQTTALSLSNFYNPQLVMSLNVLVTVW